MIIDNVNNLGLYKGLNERIDAAIDYIAANGVEGLEIGKTVIDGDNIFAATSEYAVKLTPGDYEAHDIYADIQVIVSGYERIDWCERKNCVITDDRRPDKDCVMLATEGRFTQLMIEKGQFALFLPEDAHRPNLSADGKESRVRKAVFKVKL